MNVDDVLHFLAPLTPAVLPVIVFVWHRTRRELRDIRRELTALRQEPLPIDPRLDELIESVDGIRAELARLGESQRTALRLLSEREIARAQIGHGSAEGPG
jgi:hypothetical protein